MLRLALLLVVWLPSAAAKAETVEEAVALVTSGFEAGLTTATPCGDFQPAKMTAASPATYAFDCGAGSGGLRYETVFRRIDGCRFETFLAENGREPDVRYVLDFSKFRGLLPPRGDPTKTGHFFDADADFCTPSDGGNCLALFVSMANGECCTLTGLISRDRVEAALSRIKADCRK